jgi:UDP-GlcNAc3NAcA epimerase
MLQGLEELLERERPDVLVVYGDTNSTLAGALAASKLQIPLAHVEAGLRSFNRRMPEEINRIVTDSISDLLFAPTTRAVEQLRCEGQPSSRVVWTGDVMYDAALLGADIARSRSRVLEELGLADKSYYLATVHRAENTDDAARLAAIVGSLTRVAAHHPVVLPLHPRTRAALERADLLGQAMRTLRVIEPVGFIDMIRLEMGALAIASDSGGVQKEAFFYRVPCFILRDETEWVELVDAGWNTVLPPEDAERMAATMLALDSRRPREISPYGEGNASHIIVDELVKRYGG